MQLWTDYEGVTIDGAFPLNKLLLPEGRSAFFSTANGKGDPVVMRLIECHFDEEEILARWRCLEALNHPNFLKLERYGQIEIDGSPVVYAVFEKVDANLAGVLDGGHLSVKDTAQLASSLTSALDMLHTHGFVHEHVSPGNIFAVGDVVKLRSDCIKEAPEGEAGLAAKRRDVHDLSVVLLQALTRRRSLEGMPESALPSPFDQIVRLGMNGIWGVSEIRTALEGKFKLAAATAAPAEPSKEKMTAESKPAGNQEASKGWSDNVVRDRMRQEIADDHEERRYFSMQTKWLAVAGLAVVFFFISFWFLTTSMHGHSTHPTASSHAAASPAKTAPKKQAVATPPAGQVPVAASAALNGRTQWRVIAYTYNHKDDAQKKADSLAQQHPDLQPAVFAPKGRSPYLVSIGGVMEKDAAFALAHRARRLGLPHDTYAQNYATR